MDGGQKRLLSSSLTLQERMERNAQKKKEARLAALVRTYDAKKAEKQLSKRWAAAEGGGSTTPSGGAATGGASASAASAGGGRATPSGGAATGGARASTAPSVSDNLARLLKASEMIAYLSVSPEQDASPVIQPSSTEESTIIASHSIMSLNDTNATAIARASGGGATTVGITSLSPPSMTEFIKSSDLEIITAKVTALGGSLNTTGLEHFNRLLYAICTFPVSSTSSSFKPFFKTELCLTIKRILCDFIHDAHDYARQFSIGTYLNTIMGASSGCEDEISRLYTDLLAPRSGTNRPEAIHTALEKILEKMGTDYPSIFTKSLASNIIEDDISSEEMALRFVRKLCSLGIIYLMLDSQSGNPTFEIFSEIAKLIEDSCSHIDSEGAYTFRLLNTVASEADGASKLSQKSAGLVRIDNTLRDDVTLPVRNMYANRTHTMMYRPAVDDDKGGPTIVVTDGTGISAATAGSATGGTRISAATAGSATGGGSTGAAHILKADFVAGASLNSLANAAKVPLVRAGKNPKPVIIDKVIPPIPRGRPLPETPPHPTRAETLLIKPLTDLAQVYFAALLYHVYGIKTVFITMDKYCLYVAALFCLPVVMYAHPGGQRIYSFSKGVFELEAAQIRKIHTKLLGFSGMEWSAIKSKIDSIRNYYWQIYNNSPFIIPFILASRVLVDINEIERESLEKFKSIQQALTAFSIFTPSSTNYGELLQHCQNHAALEHFTNTDLTKYIFDDINFMNNVSKNMKELHSALTLGDYPIETKLGSQTWAEVKVAIDRAVSELTTILSEYSITDNHEEIIAIYIAQQLFENSYLTRMLFTPSAGSRPPVAVAAEIPEEYKIYFNYWAVLKILFGVANEVRNIDGIRQRVKHKGSRLNSIDYIKHTIPIRQYLHKGGIPVSSSASSSSKTDLPISYSNIVTGVHQFIITHLTKVNIATTFPSIDIYPDTIFERVRELEEELQSIDSLFTTVSPATAAAAAAASGSASASANDVDVNIGGYPLVSAATAGSASAPVKTTHDLYQFVKCVLSIYDNPPGAAAASATATVVAPTDSECPEIIQRVLTYIYDNMTAAYIGTVADPGERSFPSGFNITVSQHGGANSDDEEDEATETEEKEEEEVDENFDDIEMLAETLADIHKKQEETDAAAALYSGSTDAAHASIDESVDEAIAAAREALKTSADKGPPMSQFLNLLYSLCYDAAESHEGTAFLSKYHTLESLLAWVTDPAQRRMILRYYLVQEEVMSKYTSYLIPADVIDGFLKAFDRLTVAPATVTADTVSAKAPPGEEMGGQASARGAEQQGQEQLSVQSTQPLTQKQQPDVQQLNQQQRGKIPTFVQPLGKFNRRQTARNSKQPPSSQQSQFTINPLSQSRQGQLAGGARRRRTTASRKPRRQTRRLRPRQQRRTRRQQRQAAPRQHKSDMPPLE